METGVYVLVKTDPSHIEAVERFLEGFGAVHSVERVAGPYDLVMSTTLNRGPRVVALLHSLPGVRTALALSELKAG